MRRPNEKEHVERLLDFSRCNLLVPVPRVNCLETLDRQLEERRRAKLSRLMRGKPDLQEQLPAEERSALRPLPQQTCEARRLEQAHADSLSVVRFDRNRYSVPTKYAYQQIKIVATLDEVRLSVEGNALNMFPARPFQPLRSRRPVHQRPKLLSYPLEQWRQSIRPNPLQVEQGTLRLFRWRVIVWPTRILTK